MSRSRICHPPCRRSPPSTCCSPPCPWGCTYRFRRRRSPRTCLPRRDGPRRIPLRRSLRSRRPRTPCPRNSACSTPQRRSAPSRSRNRRDMTRTSRPRRTCHCRNKPAPCSARADISVPSNTDRNRACRRSRWAPFRTRSADPRTSCNPARLRRSTNPIGHRNRRRSTRSARPRKRPRCSR